MRSDLKLEMFQARQLSAQGVLQEEDCENLESQDEVLVLIALSQCSIGSNRLLLLDVCISQSLPPTLDRQIGIKQLLVLPNQQSTPHPSFLLGDQGEKGEYREQLCFLLLQEALGQVSQRVIRILVLLQWTSQLKQQSYIEDRFGCHVQSALSYQQQLHRVV